MAFHAGVNGGGGCETCLPYHVSLCMSQESESHYMPGVVLENRALKSVVGVPAPSSLATKSKALLRASGCSRACTGAF